MSVMKRLYEIRLFGAPRPAEGPPGRTPAAAHHEHRRRRNEFAKRKRAAGKRYPLFPSEDDEPCP